MADLDGRGFIRRGKTLVPADFVAEEWLETIPENKEIILDWRKPRSPENHRHMYAIMRVACEQLSGYADEDSLMEAVKIACGHVRPIQKLNGEIVFLPRSINFAAMEEAKFQRFKLRALHVLGQLLGVDPVTLLKEVPPMKKGKK